MSILDVADVFVETVDVVVLLAVEKHPQHSLLACLDIAVVAVGIAEMFAVAGVAVLEAVD